MNATDALKLTRLVAALAPGTKITQDSPAAWALVLDDVPLPDALTAARTVYRDRGSDKELGARRLEPDDILREVKRMRQARLDAAPEYVPSRLGMTVAEELAELREYRQAIAAGVEPPHRPAVEGSRRLALPGPPRHRGPSEPRRVGHLPNPQ